MVDQPATQIVYVEQAPLEEIAKRNPISAAGFTSELPARFKTLNDALVKGWDGSPIEFVDIVLHPDQLYAPAPLVRTEYKSSKKVTLRIIPPSEGMHGKREAQAYLRIGEGDLLGAALSIVKLEDLQTFIRDLLPNKRAFLCWRPEIKLEGKLPIEEPIIADLLALTQSEYDLLPSNMYLLLAEGQPAPVFIVGTHKSNYTMCQLSNFRFAGTGQEVERAMDLVARLLEFNNCATMKDHKAAQQNAGNGSKVL